MKIICAILLLLAITSFCVSAQNRTNGVIVNNPAEQEIIELEKRFNRGIVSRDADLMKTLLADDFYLAVGVRNQPLAVVARAAWLENLKDYKIQSYSTDDVLVKVYGDTAVVLLTWTQKARAGREGKERSGQFVLTDIWVRQKDGWRVAARHSSRPE
jgi:hypothetical protein